MKKKSINSKNIIILAVITIIIVIIASIIISRSNKLNELNFDEFEKVAIYNYLENDILIPSTLYLSSGDSNFDTLQIFQSKLKQALDTYFSSNSETEVSTSTILGSIDSAYIPDNVDFHGIVVSDYKYHPESNTFVKSPGAYSNIANVESEINSIDHSNKKSVVKSIEMTSDNKYKVYFDIVDISAPDDSVVDSGEAILIIKDNSLSIESCDFND